MAIEKAAAHFLLDEQPPRRRTHITSPPLFAADVVPLINVHSASSSGLHPSRKHYEVIPYIRPGRVLVADCTDLSRMASRSNPKVSAPPEPREQWQFVNISSPVQSRDTEFKRLVRGTAMRNHRRNEKRNRVQAFSETTVTGRDARVISRMGEDRQSAEELPPALGAAAGHELVIRTDADWWRRELKPLLDVLEAALPPKRANETLPRIASTTEMPPSRSRTVKPSQRRPYTPSSQIPSTIINPQTYLDTDIGDPFGSYPGSSSPQRQRLMHHCKYLVCLVVQPLADDLSTLICL